MKKVATVIAILVLLALDWAALDDITTGNEPNYIGEYLILVGSLVIFALLGFWYLKNHHQESR